MIAGSKTTSGMRKCLRSYVKMTMRELAIYQRKIVSKILALEISLEIRNWELEISRNINPVDTSTNKYCHDIFCLQYRHFPRSHKKLKTGTKSNHESWCLQYGQYERPPTPSFCSRRKIITFKKLPRDRPNTKTKTLMMRGICNPLIN